MLQGYSGTVNFRRLGNLEVLLLAIQRTCIRPQTVETELALELENNYSKMHLEIDQIQKAPNC